ncbi:3019_t:CDS:2 [Entrophospora sp. SA101]|nr:3019_t:CDS:2 [Entrophospora sp. SA101]
MDEGSEIDKRQACQERKYLKLLISSSPWKLFDVRCAQNCKESGEPVGMPVRDMMIRKDLIPRMPNCAGFNTLP